MATIGESSPVQVESIAVNKPDLTLDIESRPPPHHVGSVGEDCALSAKWSVGDPDADVADTCPIDDVTWRAGTCILPKSSDIDMAPALTPGSDMQHAFQRIRITSVSENEPIEKDAVEASKFLITALKLRQQYMARSCQPFCVSTQRILNSSQGAKCKPATQLDVPPATATVLSTSTSEDSNMTDRRRTSLPVPDYQSMTMPGALASHVEMVNGIVRVWSLAKDGEGVCGLPHAADGEEMEIDLQQPDFSSFLNDFKSMLALSVDGPVKSFCYRRLRYLELRYQMHELLNETKESSAQRSVPHRDFYNVRKVDTHIHAASAMNQKHLLRFIKKKIRTSASETVCVRDGRHMSLQDVFESLDLTAHDLSVDKLDVHADRDTFHRFDKFNLKYNPIGESRLREIFLKSDNFIEGRYFAEILKEVISDLEDSKYQMAEMRLSIYGRHLSEWPKLATWAVANNLCSSNVRWLIQVPRLYSVYRAKGLLNNFEEMLHNIFVPLFEATLNPEAHPEMHQFLTQVAGFDSVDDESKPEQKLSKHSPEPKQWSGQHNPPYAYYLFYMYANITALNNLRRMRGMNTFSLRPHCGESGPVHHLAAAFLLAENISHGLLLRKVPALQYLFYLAQVGVAMSPLSNNSLFLDYTRSPLPEFRARGLLISLSTDDPLMFHYTREPLIEEYSIAAQVWKLNSCDLSELARNSVLMSGFAHEVKQHWLGQDYDKEGVSGNNIRCTNVPNVRISYRHETLTDELEAVFFQ